MYKIIILTLFFIISSACTSTASRNPDSQYYEIPLTIKISLVKELTIPANTAHILFQGGEIKSTRAKKQYHPFCRFEVNTLSEKAQTIQPNSYTINKINSDQDVVSIPDIRYYYTEFYLSSTKDTNVRLLICGQWSSANDSSTYLTIKQMQNAVGRYMSIKLPETINNK